MIFLDEAAMIGNRAVLAPGSEQLTCCPLLSQKVSEYIHFNLQLLRFAHLESGRVHLEALWSQTKTSYWTTVSVLPTHVVKGRRQNLSILNTTWITEPTLSNLGHHSSSVG